MIQYSELHTKDKIMNRKKQKSDDFFDDDTTDISSKTKNYLFL